MNNILKEKIVQLVKDDARTFLSLWDTDRNISIGDAVDLLSAWGHMHRFSPDTFPEELVKKVEEAIFSVSIFEWVEWVYESFDSGEWIQSLKSLSLQVDDSVDSDDFQANRIDSRQLFDSFDQAELAVWAFGRRCKNFEKTKTYDGLVEEMVLCRFALEEEIDVFRNLSGYVKSFVDSYREDLCSFDADLWWTVSKFDLIIDYDSKLEKLNTKSCT